MPVHWHWTFGGAEDESGHGLEVIGPCHIRRIEGGKRLRDMLSDRFCDYWIDRKMRIAERVHVPRGACDVCGHVHETNSLRRLNAPRFADLDLWVARVLQKRRQPSKFQLGLAKTTRLILSPPISRASEPKSGKVATTFSFACAEKEQVSIATRSKRILFMSLKFVGAVSAKNEFPLEKDRLDLPCREEKVLLQKILIVLQSDF